MGWSGRAPAQFGAICRALLATAAHARQITHGETMEDAADVTNREIATDWGGTVHASHI
jgi:hypothetical protein